MTPKPGMIDPEFASLFWAGVVIVLCGLALLFFPDFALLA